MRAVIIGLLCLSMVAGIYFYMTRAKSRAGTTPSAGVGGPAAPVAAPQVGTPPQQPVAAQAGAGEEQGQPDMVIGLEMGKDSDKPEVTVGVNDVAGAKVNANLSKGTAEISGGQRDKAGEGFLGKVQVDKDGEVEGRVEYGVRF